MRILNQIEVENEEIVSFGVSPNEQWLVTSSKNSIARIWELESRTFWLSFKLNQTLAKSFCFDESSRFIGIGCANGSVKVFDLARSKLTHEFQSHRGVCSQVRFLPKRGQLQLFSSGDDSTICVHDLVLGLQTATFKVGRSVIQDFCFTNDAKIMFVTTRDQKLSIWGVESQERKFQ